jgi:polyphenol oxidase
VGRGDPGEALSAWTGRTIGAHRARRVRWVEQVHGSEVIVLGAGGHPATSGAEGCAAHDAADRTVACAGTADALVTDTSELALAVLTADCASIALGSPEGVLAAVHAGWRGLVAGVVGEAVAAMRRMGATAVVGALGPCIHADCYEFSEADLDPLVGAWGERARSRTKDGLPALDLPAAVAGAFAECEVRQVAGRDACTSCSPGYFSHRARGDRGRQALVVWSGPDGRP